MKPKRVRVLIEREALRGTVICGWLVAESRQCLPRLRMEKLVPNTWRAGSVMARRLPQRTISDWHLDRDADGLRLAGCVNAERIRREQGLAWWMLPPEGRQLAVQ